MASSWWERFGEEWASTGITDDPTTQQADVGWAYIGQAPPTVEQFNSIQQWNDDKDNWLYGQIANVIASAGMTPDEADLTQLLRAIQSKQKLLLTANLNLYVDALNGDDVGGNGTTNLPWKTIQHCYDYCKTYLEMAGFSVICNLKAPATYAAIAAAGTPLNGIFLIYGDPLNPRSYLIKNTNGPAVSAYYGAGIHLQGISIEAAGGTVDYSSWGVGMVANNSGYIIFQDVAFGPCQVHQMVTQLAGIIWTNGSINYSIYGGANTHYASDYGGGMNAVASHCTITGNPVFATAFAYALALGVLQAWTQTFTGTAQGVRANVDSNAIINLQGQDPNVLFPGTSPAVQARGGLYL
jgi:hypothetical protein